MGYQPITLVGTVPFDDGETASTNPISGTIPAAAQAGDLGIFIAATNTSATSTYTPPSGWSSLGAAVSPSGTLETQLFAKDLVAADAGANISWSNSATPSRFIGVLAVYRGTLGSGSIIVPAAATSTTASTTLTEPSVTTTLPFSWVVGLWAMRVATAAPSPTLTYPGTETFDARARTAFTASPNYTIELSHLTSPGDVGSYGGTSATASASTTNQVVYVVAIPPAPIQKQPINRARYRAATW